MGLDNYRLKKGIGTDHPLNPGLLTTDACAQTIVQMECNMFIAYVYSLFNTDLCITEMSL